MFWQCFQCGFWLDFGRTHVFLIALTLAGPSGDGLNIWPGSVFKQLPLDMANVNKLYFVGPDLGLNYLQRLSANDRCHHKWGIVKNLMNVR